jgi:hypothetical protein
MAERQMAAAAARALAFRSETRAGFGCQRADYVWQRGRFDGDNTLVNPFGLIDNSGRYRE